MKSGTDQPSRGASLVEQTNSDYEFSNFSFVGESSAASEDDNFLVVLEA